MKNFGNLGFFDLSKEILNLDLVISSDTSILHLSSSLGIKTYGLLGYRADWRWLDDDKKYSWYNSLEIFKLKKNQNWEDLSNTIVDNIIKLI
jgi:ADP-heptose:LPS heptosyltransferase